MLLCMKVVQETLVLSIAVLNHCGFLAVTLQLCPQACRVDGLDAGKIIFAYTCNEFAKYLFL